MIILNGKKYTQCSKTTLKQDWLLRSLLTSSLYTSKEIDADDAENEIQKLVYASIDNGSFAKIIACTITVDGQDWTPEQAKETEAAINACTDTFEKNTLQAYYIDMLISFFKVGLLSWNATSKSLETETTAAQAQQNQATNMNMQNGEILPNLYNTQPQEITTKQSVFTKIGNFLRFWRK